MVIFNVDRNILTDVLVAHGRYPGLGPPFVVSGRTLLHGQLEVFDGDGVQWGGFVVMILFPMDYPYTPPLLYEMQGRIKREADWHVNQDGSLCLGPGVGEMRKYMGRAWLVDWLDRSAMPFLANHLYKERTGSYLNGEYAHGVEGIWEYYQKEWQCSRAEVLNKLKMLRRVPGHARQTNERGGSNVPLRNRHPQQEEMTESLRRAYANDHDRLRGAL